MKITLTLITTLLNLSFGYGQSQSELLSNVDNLNALIYEIDSQIYVLNQKKLTLRNQVAKLNQLIAKSEVEQKQSKAMVVIVNGMGGVLRDQPSITGVKIAEVSAGDTVLVYDLSKEPYFRASHKDRIGFISYISLSDDSRINDIVAKTQKTIDNPKFVQLLKKYGNHNAKRVVNGEYWLGMSSEMAKESIGHPDDVNKSTGSWGIHEQWIYKKKDLYLYFENGKLTSFQE